MIRLFLGLPIPDVHRNALSKLQAKLPHGRAVSWENFHITMVFLGETSDSVAQELHENILSKQFFLPELSIDGIGHFGGVSPRAVWASVKASDELKEMVAGLGVCARQAGIRIQRRRFVPHVTLMRFRIGEVAAADLAQVLETLGRFQLPSFQPNELVLYESQLRPEGPRYTELQSYPVIPSQTI